MDLRLLAVGKLRPAYRDAGDEYLKRLRRYASIQEIEIREASRAPTGVVQRREEAARLRARLPDAGFLVALDREGTYLTSEALAHQLKRWGESPRTLAFLLGGSTGLADDIRQAAAFRWSLGPLTLPHELARVVVLEQLYRAFTILRGEPYHK
jgi:23S rRNA (pseudouridine1915-N3)-methyltransferase